MARVSKEKPKASLKDIEVLEISSVDRAANGRRFLVVKDEEGKGTPASVETPPAVAPPADVSAVVPPAAAVDVAPDAPASPSSEAPTAPIAAPTEAEPVAIDKAKWSTAQINDLPDASFLYVETGGEKDSDGKTAPRSLRHFPVKDADGNVDMPHLKNALSRIPQSDLPQEIKDKCSAKAEKMMADAEASTKKTEKNDVEKRGAKMAKDRLDRMKSAVDSLVGIVKELVDAEGALEGDDSTAATKVAKAADPNPLEPRVIELEKCAATAAETIQKQADEIASQKAALAKQADMLAAARISAKPNSVDPTGEPAVPPRPFDWGSDLNKDSQRAGAKRNQA